MKYLQVVVLNQRVKFLNKQHWPLVFLSMVVNRYSTMVQIQFQHRHPIMPLFLLVFKTVFQLKALHLPIFKHQDSFHLESQINHLVSHSGLNLRLVQVRSYINRTVPQDLVSVLPILVLHRMVH